MHTNFTINQTRMPRRRADNTTAQGYGCFAVFCLVFSICSGFALAFSWGRLDKRFQGGEDVIRRLLHAGMVGFRADDGAAVGAW